MPKLENCGITIDVPENETSFYTRAGYKKVEEEPVTNPAPEKPSRGRKANSDESETPPNTEQKGGE